MLGACLKLPIKRWRETDIPPRRAMSAFGAQSGRSQECPLLGEYARIELFRFCGHASPTHHFLRFKVAIGAAELHYGLCLAGISGMIKIPYAVMIASTAIFSGELLCSDANAQTVTVEQYQHPKGEKDLIFNKSYLEGIKDGLITYNISVEDRLFCLAGMPPVLTFERASETLLRWARKRGGDVAGMSLGLALLYSLKEAFPCKGTPR